MYKQIKKNILYAPLVTCMIFMGSTIAQSQENNVDFKNKITELEQRISGLETLKIELQELKQSLEEKEKSVTVKQEKLDTEIKSLSSLQKTMSVREATPSTRWHIAGYADTSFEGVSGDANDSFVAGHFNPSFHFQFEDWILFESELEFETSGDGDAEIAVEYSQLNFLLHDNVTLVAGKFLSPVGQFQERLHPSWINRGQISQQVLAMVVLNRVATLDLCCEAASQWPMISSLHILWPSVMGHALAMMRMKLNLKASAAIMTVINPWEVD